MTLEVKTINDSMICSKCGSRMVFRKRITFRGKIIRIRQCTVCRHYEPANN